MLSTCFQSLDRLLCVYENGDTHIEEYVSFYTCILLDIHFLVIFQLNSYLITWDRYHTILAKNKNESLNFLLFISLDVLHVEMQKQLGGIGKEHILIAKASECTY
jgi:hypothetical protein